MSCLYLPAPKSCSLLFPKLGSFTPSRPLSSSPWSPSQKARTSSRYVPLLLKAKVRSINVSRLQACLNAPEPAPGAENGVDGESAADSPEEVTHPQIPAPQATMPRGNAGIHPNYITPEQQHQIAYQQYMQQQQQQQSVGGQYPMPPQARMPHQQQPSG